MSFRLLQVYQCLCDETRLRILHLLSHRSLNVGEMQQILEISQVKASKHLAYMRKREMVESRKEENRVIYSLPKKRVPFLEKNLRCIQDCVQEHSIFQADLERLHSYLHTPSQKVLP